MNDNDIKLLIKDSIRKRGHNNTSLAAAIGVSEGTVRRIINVDVEYNPTLKQLRALSKELNIPINVLIGTDD